MYINPCKAARLCNFTNFLESQYYNTAGKTNFAAHRSWWMTPLGYLHSRHRGWTLSHPGVIPSNWNFLHYYSKFITISLFKVAFEKFKKWKFIKRSFKLPFPAVPKQQAILTADCRSYTCKKGVKRNTSNKLFHMKNESFLMFVLFASFLLFPLVTERCEQLAHLRCVLQINIRVLSGPFSMMLMVRQHHIDCMWYTLFLCQYFSNKTLFSPACIANKLN